MLQVHEDQQPQLKHMFLCLQCVMHRSLWTPKYWTSGWIKESIDADNRTDPRWQAYQVAHHPLHVELSFEVTGLSYPSASSCLICSPVQQVFHWFESQSMSVDLALSDWSLFNFFSTPQEFLVSLTLRAASWCSRGLVLNGITERENHCFLSWHPAP